MRIGTHVLMWSSLSILAVFMIWPILLTVAGGLQSVDSDGNTRWTLQYVTNVFIDPVLRNGLINSLLVAVLVTILSFVIAMPLAILATQYRFRGQGIFTSLILVPLILPPFVGAIGLREILGRMGGLNSLLIDLGMQDPSAPIDFLGTARFAGVVVMEALHLYPIMYLNVVASLANIDPSLNEAADNLGASRWTRFRRILLPLILPGLFAGSTIVFIWSFTELGTPLMFDFYDVMPVQVFWGIQEMSSSPRPYGIVIVMLAMAAGLYLISKLTIGRHTHEASVRVTMAAHTTQLTGTKAFAAMALFAAITFLAVTPHIGVVLTSFSATGAWYQSPLPTAWTLDHYHAALGGDMAVGSIRNSLLYAFLSMVVDVLLGLMIAYLVVRSRVRGRHLLDSLSMLPLAVPGLVLAFGYVAMTLHWPFPQLAAAFNQAGLEGLASLMQVTGERPDPTLFLVIAYAIRRLPYVVRTTVAGLQQTSGQLEEAALNLGASKLYTIRRIVVPMIVANLLAGALLAFSFAMLEVSDSLILAQTEDHYPITKTILALFERLGDGPHIASAMGVWGMMILTITLVGVSMMLGKKIGSVFRI